MLILEDEMKAISDQLFVTTDDGSYGHHGFVTDELKRLIEEKTQDRPGPRHRPGHHDEGGRGRDETP